MQKNHRNTLRVGEASLIGLLVAVLLLLGGVCLCGCKSPTKHRAEADRVASEIIAQKQLEATGRTESFSIDRPSDILRRRLLEEQGLLFAGPASLGTDKLEPIEHWPQDDYPPRTSSPDAARSIEPNRPLKLSLVDVLEVAAGNSFEYQSRKEAVFQTALGLDLARNQFRNIVTVQGQSGLSVDTAGDDTVTVDSGAVAGISRRFKNGLDLSSAISLDLMHWLTNGGGSLVGLRGDASVSYPLLRGSGRHIITEPLTQAERDVVYEMWNFERFKRTFAVSVAREYFSVLSQMDRVKNAEDNYRSSVVSARWSRRRTDAGRMDAIEMDQATQRELSARNNWISAQERLKGSLDSFKVSLGLPPDALIELDPNDLTELRGRSDNIIAAIVASSEYEAAETAPPADARVDLEPASNEDAGPLELDERVAVRLALDRRLDLKVAMGVVYDAQREVVIRADALRAGLDLGGSASVSDTDADGSLSLGDWQFGTLLSVDLPIERTAERNEYRNSLISLERATRNVQTLEDDIKLAIRDKLRALLLSREGLKIQAQSVVVAQKRVRSSQLFLEAGRIQIRDLLEAQDDLLAAQNDLTSALVEYRIAELEIQRDMGVLAIDDKGLWQEFSPEEIKHDS